MRLFFYVLLSLMIIWSNSLKIFENSLSAKDYKLFYHRTADFGPRLNTYNISASLQIMRPLTACNIDQYVNRNASDYIEGGEARKYHQIYKDEIVLILRGNCTFSNKVYNAQLLGAIGAIIGDYNTTGTEEWIVMSKDDDGNHIEIPAVFVPHNTYQWILKLLLSYTDTNNNNENDNIIVINGVYAMLDSDGEYIAPTSTFWLAAFGIVIIVIPTLWCFIVCMALLRKKIINYIQRSRRRQHLTQIPIILYKGSGKEEACVEAMGGSVPSMNSIGLSVINKTNTANKNKNNGNKASDDDEYVTTSYAKLVNMNDNDTEQLEDGDINDNDIQSSELSGDDEKTSSLSTNFKTMSRYLLNTFRSKKEHMNPHNDSCAICLDDFKINEELRLLPCNHGFHTRCIDPWLSKSSELCPMCKQSIFMNSENENGGGTYSILKICCISNGNNNQSQQEQQQEQQQNGNGRRRRRRRPRINSDSNNDGNENIMDDNNNNDNDGILVMSDSNHSHSDDNDEENN